MKKKFYYRRLGYINKEIVHDQIAWGEWFNEREFLESLSLWNRNLGDHISWIYGPVRTPS